MGAYEELLGKLKNIDLIGQIGGLVSWDQEVLMPPKAATLRAEQLAWISKTGHELLTHPRIGELIVGLEASEGLDEVQAANVRLTRESYDKATKLPTEFVSEMAKHTTSRYSETVSLSPSISHARRLTTLVTRSCATTLSSISTNLA